MLQQSQRTLGEEPTAPYRAERTSNWDWAQIVSAKGNNKCILPDHPESVLRVNSATQRPLDLEDLDSDQLGQLVGHSSQSADFVFGHQEIPMSDAIYPLGDAVRALLGVI